MGASGPFERSPGSWLLRDPAEEFWLFPLSFFAHCLKTQNVNTSGIESTFSKSSFRVTKNVSRADRGDFENPRRLPGAWGEMLKGQGGGSGMEAPRDT